MTDAQRAMLDALSRCTFGVGNFDKRFVRDLAPRTKEYELSDRQDWYLRRTYYRYRKQIGHHDPKPLDFDQGPLKPSSVAEIERDGVGNMAAYLRPSASERRRIRDEQCLKLWNEGRLL